MKNTPILENDNRILFATLFFVYFTISFTTNNLVFTENFYLNILSKQFSANRIESYLQSKLKYEWLGYALMQIILAIKLFTISSIIYIGLFFSNIIISFKNVLKIVMIAESMMVLAAFVKLSYFLIFNISDIEFLKRFSPLSIISFINVEEIPFYLIYPLQLLNLFEVAYWLLLAYGIKYLCKINYLNAFKILGFSYGFGLIIWCIFIMFLQLQFS